MRQEVGEEFAGVFNGLFGADRLELRRALRRREVEVYARQVAADAPDLLASGRDDVGSGDECFDWELAKEARVADRWPDRIQGAFDLEPIEGHARADVLSGAAGDLADAESVPRNGDGVEDDGLMGIKPGDDLTFLRFHRGSGESREQAATFLLLALFVGAEDSGLRGVAGVRLAVRPAEAPDGETQAIVAGVDR